MPREIGLGNNINDQGFDGDIDFDFFDDDDEQSRTKDASTIVKETQNESTEEKNSEQLDNGQSDTKSIDNESDNIDRWVDSELDDTFESDTESENSLDVTVTEESTSSSWSQDDSFQSLSEDEITDVTPMSSTTASPLPASPNRLQVAKSIFARKRSAAVKFNDDNKKMADSTNSSSMNLDLLVKAILKLEQDRKKNGIGNFSLPQKERLGSGRSKKNMSFTDDQVRKIDRENQLLLKKILTQQQQTTKTTAARSRPLKPASSAINRIRQQKKIEAENLTLLKRIQSAKPTKELSRQYLLKSHEQLHGSSDSASVYVRKSNSSSQMSLRSVSSVPIPIAQSKTGQSRARVRSNRATQARTEWNAKIHAKS